MKTSSAKAKGRKLQQWLRDKLLAIHLTLEPDDIKSTGMGQSGEDIQLSPAARKLIPYTFECKNVEKLNVWAAYDQACEHGKGEPVLVMKRNNRNPLVVVDAEHFLKGIKRDG
jgi:hypothetical protein